jgi:hypothetical protein
MKRTDMPVTPRAPARAREDETPHANAALVWLRRNRLDLPRCVSRRDYPVTLAEIAKRIGEPEGTVLAALKVLGYDAADGRVNMMRLWWRHVAGKPPVDDATRRRQLDAIAAAWSKQLGAPADVGTALAVGGELREAITAATAPEMPSRAGLAKLLRHGQARGDEWAFELTATAPRRYAARRLADEPA